MEDLGVANLNSLLADVNFLGTGEGPTLVVKKEETPFLCLNMIVKNESKIILRLLTSVLPIIDSVCICDTGSTDNTVELIEAFLKEHSLPGVIVKEPFVNFGYNRTVSFQRAQEYCRTGGWDLASTYGILIDADMVLTTQKIWPPRITYWSIFNFSGSVNGTDG